MEKLWAPWRVEYIEGGNKKGCIFCPPQADGNLIYNDYTLYTGKHSIALLNKFPYNNAHLLIAPKRHEANLENLPAEESGDLQRLMAESITILKTVYKPEGF
ncbi:MAG: HIT domain-containing protein, partial [Deltaproteobacteria bacterium]